MAETAFSFSTFMARSIVASYFFTSTSHRPPCIAVRCRIADSSASWKSVIDPASGNPYYWNTETNETTWELPTGWRSEDNTSANAEENQVDPQSKISEQQNEFLALKSTFLQLQEDFKYNLALLHDRDTELEEYDTLLDLLEASLKEKESALEELGTAICKSSAENLQEKENAKLCKESMMHKICNLEQVLEDLQVESEERIKKQEESFELTKAELKKQLLRNEKQVHQLKMLESEHLKNLENQILISEWESDGVNLKLQDMEVKFLELEHNMKSSLDEKNRKLQELSLDITKLTVEEDNLKACYEDNLKRLRDDARHAEKEYSRCISQEIERVNQLILRLDGAQSRFNKFENMMTERLLVFSGKVQCVEQEVLNMREYEMQNKRNIESRYLESLRLHEMHLKEAKHEASKWNTEYDLLQRKCMDLEKKSLQNTNLESENRHLQESLRDLNDQNERIQKVVATLRMEMETLQDAMTQGNYRHNDAILSGIQVEEQMAKDLREELQFLKSKISNMSLKLDGIHVSSPETRKKAANHLQASESTRMTHKSSALSCSDEEMSARLAELEQTQMNLKAQLEATLANAARIADERDLLMDLNNSLHADLSRTMQCTCMSQYHHDIGDKKKLDGLCCHDVGCLEKRVRLQNNQLTMASSPKSIATYQQCCSAWNSCNEAAVHRECCNMVLPNSSMHETLDQKPTTSRSILHVEGNVAKYHERTSASEDVTRKGTSSQHARLRSLVRRHEDIQSNRPKVRNYNIKDDNT